MSISIREHQVLDKANPEQIEFAFNSLENNFLNSTFLSNKNYLKNSAAKIITKQFGKSPVRRKKLLSKYTIEYIAASALQHNIESWNYFGHALSALLRGDDQTSRHLFYYSELRSAMSFLATQGIGVFNDKHITITSNSKAVLINEKFQTNPHGRWNNNSQPTHSFTWETIDYFINNNDKLVKLFDGYLVDGNSLNLWLEKFGVNASMRISISKDFLRKLSFDLDHFSRDREARNEVSYRPTCMEGIPNFDHNQNLKDIEEIWEFSRPNIKKGEIQFDLIFLADILQLAFKKTHPNEFSYKQAKNQFQSKLKIMLDDIGITESRKIELISFFMGDRESLYTSLSLTDISSPQFKKGMLYRGFIFARLSTVFCKKLLNSSSSIDKNKLQFWWGPLGNHFGLWEDSGEPEDFADLWSDFEDHRSSLTDIINNKPEMSTKEFWRSNYDLGFVLSTCSRIGFWGLGI